MFILPAGDGRRLVKHVKAEGAAERFTEVGEFCFVQEEQGRGPPLMTREHIEECPGFAFLRAGKELIDMKEQSEFFLTVMRFRSMR